MKRPNTLGDLQHAIALIKKKSKVEKTAIDNFQTLRQFCANEIIRRTGKPFSRDTILQYQDDLDFRLSAFEATEAGQRFKTSDFGKRTPVQQIYLIYAQQQNTLVFIAA